MRARARLRHIPGTMNKLEQKFELELMAQKATAMIGDYGFERLKLKLAPATFYTPDFDAILANGYIDLFEVKGFWEDDARVKIKCAAQMFPQFGFVGVTWNKRDGWIYERIGA